MARQKLTFDVYKNGELLGKDKTFHELLNFFNLTSISLKTYISNRKQNKLMIQGHLVIVNTNDRRHSEFTNGLIADWDNMTIAAELIRTGQGKIERRLINGNYRKVTVPNEIH